MHDSVTFSVPRVRAWKRPSDRRGSVGRFLQPDLKRNQEEIGWEARKAGCLPTNQPVSLAIRMGNEPGDADNYMKTVMDALQRAGVLMNDRQVRQARIDMTDPKGSRAMITLRELHRGEKEA